MASYTSSATALKRSEGRRNLRVELIGMKADDTPTITSSIVFNIVNEQPNRTAVDRHRLVAHPGEIEAATSYFIRVLVQQHHVAIPPSLAGRQRGRLGGRYPTGSTDGAGRGDARRRIAVSRSA